MPQHTVVDRYLVDCANALVDVLHSPRFWGLEHLDARRPLLLVCNHSVYGLPEAAVLWMRIYAERGIQLRTVSDHMHFRVPLWRELLTHYGGFDGTPENCAELLARGENVLVHPGGGREVAKRRGEKYRLMWKDRLGFVRLAIEHGCTIVPVSAVGGEDVLDIVVDADELIAAIPQLLTVVEWLGWRRELLLPITRGIGPTPLPRLERLYFKLSQPIDTTVYNGDTDDVATCRALKTQVQRAVQEGIRFLRREQAQDPERTLLGRITG